jgi:hypothetical protein
MATLFSTKYQYSKSEVQYKISVQQERGSVQNIGKEEQVQYKISAQKEQSLVQNISTARTRFSTKYR